MAFWARADAGGRGWRRTSASGAVAAAMLALAGPARGATLNEHCIVSVLNRSAKVQADGSWVLPNVPSNIGRVRVRATCVEGGITRSGQSDYFTVPPSGAIKVPAILFDDASPVPSRLDLTVADATLHSVGASEPLTARATYPGGSTLDVTPAVRGTNYTSSNPAIVSVSEDGLVTARAGGIAIVTALNDGASGLLRLSVVLTGDTDGDGIPDDVEIANGLNPSDPVDALEDYDHDGLTNFQELMVYGTDVRKADTDGDTLVDGDEITRGTNPLLFDTDGDGIGDGLEVGTGSNPLDPGSFNLASALQSIEVQPSVVVLVVNALVGEASRQLQVTGHLVDGRTLDLTSTSRGTNYASSDLLVVNFGGTDGQIFAGSDGLATVTVSIPNSPFSASVSVRVRSFTPQALSSLQLPFTGYANNVDVAGDHAYIAFGSGGLLVVDVADRAHPLIVGTLDTPGTAIDVRVVGNLAYVADGASGLQVIDVSDPTHPVLRGTLDTPGVAEDLVVRGNRVFIADGPSGLQIADVSNPAVPVLIGSLDTPGEARGVDVSGTLAVIADGPGQLVVVDVSMPNAPLLRGSVFVPGEVMDVTARDRIAYVSSFTGSVQVVDFAVPTAPQLVPPGAQGFVPRDFELSGRFGIAAEQLFPNVVAIVELSDPRNPLFSSTIDFEPLGDYAGTGIALDASYVYMTGENFVVQQSPYGSTGNTRLFIGKYLEVSDEGGVAPTVEITSPADGSGHIAGSTLTVHAEAHDDVGVAGVTFSVDGVPFSSDFTSPFELSYTLPSSVTSVTFGATATDFGGNQGNAPPVTVSVLPDPAPVVTLTSPAEGASLIEGQTVTLIATASDNVSVRQVSFTVNGTTLAPGTYDQPSVTHSQNYVVGIGISQLTVTATVTDNLGQTSSSPSRVLAVVPDPRTTVIGLVVSEQLLPVEGVNVSVFGEFTAQTTADGTFTITGVPTVRGSIVAFAQTTVGGRNFSGASAPIPPVRGGTTAVGTIQLSEAHLEPVGTLLDPSSFDNPDDAFTQVALPFPFPFYGGTFQSVYIGTNGYLTFDFGDWTYVANLQTFNNQRRIAPLFNDWVTPQSGAEGIFVNADMPGKFVVTWQRVFRYYDTNQRATFQVTLGADGRIQFAYDGVIPTYGVVGITPGGGQPQPLDFTQSPSFTVAPTDAPYEYFTGVTGGEVHDFDLDHTFLTFTPSGAGYDGQLRVPPPILSIANPAAGASLVEGETVPLTANVSGAIASVTFSANTVPLLPDGRAPFVQSFRVPRGVSGLTFAATAVDVIGQTATASRPVTVVPEQLTSVRGTVVDDAGHPLPGAQVYLGLNGLRAEFFDEGAALTDFPDLTGVAPTSQQLVSSLDFLNPGQVFNGDTFGTHLAPHQAARMTASLLVDTQGQHRFTLAADGGARLRIDGTAVVEVPRGPSRAEASGNIYLARGTHAIEVLYYQNEGNSELQLSYARPDRQNTNIPSNERETVPASSFILDPASFATVTDAAGAFSFAGVPTALGRMRVSARATVGGEERLGTVDRLPVRGGMTEAGAITALVRLQPLGTFLGPELFQYRRFDAFAVVPFSVSLYGVTYDSVYVGTNGYLTFGSGDSSPALDLAHFTGLQPRIGAMVNHWYSYQYQPYGGIYVNTDVPGRLVVTWQNMFDYDTGEVATFQLVLGADGRVQLNFGDVAGTKGLVGISPGGGAAAQLVDVSDAFTADGQHSPYQLFDDLTRFDLVGAVLTFAPNAAGGYDGRASLGPLEGLAGLPGGGE